MKLDNKNPKNLKQENNKQKNKKRKPSKKSVLIYLLVVFIIFYVASSFLFAKKDTNKEYTYGQLVALFDEREVTSYSLDLGTGELKFKLKDGTEHEYKVPNVSLFYDAVQTSVDEYNASVPENQKIDYDLYPVKDYSGILAYLPTIILVLLMVGMWRASMKGAGGANVAGFGKAKLRAADAGRKVTFADVAGADEEKEELVEIVEFLKSPNKFNKLGARIPRGVLLEGPPGTGKTLLARAVAGEAGVPFFSISGSDFVEMFVGVGASRVRDLFEQAKKNSPAVIFIDEIDAVGRRRGAGLGGGHDEREQTLNQLLVEMDGFATNSGVIVMAATNRSDILDPALLRPGRFDRQVLVNYPDVKGREAILKVHSKNKPLAPDIDFEVIAKQTVGFTGADLENILNEAALLAAKRNLKSITMKTIEDATMKVMAGPEKKSKVVTEKDKRLTAFHEAGHAVVTYYVSKDERVHQVSIVPRGNAGGYTMSLPKEDKSYRTRNEMKENIVVLLGGRVAEKLTLDDISTGASNDIERATGIARAMVTQYGFSDKLGTVVYGDNQNEIFIGRDLGHYRNYSENVASQIDSEIKSVIDEAYNNCEKILKDHMDQLNNVAEALMQKEKLSEEDFYAIMEPVKETESEVQEKTEE